MIARVIGLGVRLGTQRGYAARLRLALLGVGVAAVTFLALGGLSVPKAMDAQELRASKLALGFGDEPSPLLAQDSQTLPSRRWAGHSVERVLVAEVPGLGPGPRIPGVKQLPGTGEAVVSPELRQALHSDPVLGALMSTYRITGTIDESGLVQPRELRAVVGVPASSPGLQPVRHVGTASTTSPTTNDLLDRALTLFLAVLIGTPTGALVVLCARLGSRQKQNRILAIRRIGLTSTQTRVVMATESILVAVPASSLGAVTYWVLTSILQRVPGTEFGYFTSDARVSALTVGLVLAAVTLLTGIAAAAGVGLVNERAAPPAARRRVRLGHIGYFVLLAGILLFLSLPVMPQGALKALSLWTAFGLSAAGIALSANGLVLHASNLLSRYARTAGSLVGLRINGQEPGSTSRMASLMAALIICIVGANGFLGLLSGGSNDRADARSGDVVLSVQDYSRMLTPKSVDDITGVLASAAVVDLEGNKDTVQALSTTCRGLEILMGGKVSRCDDAEPRWMTSSPGADVLQLTESTRVSLPGDSGTRPLPTTAEPLRIPDSTDLADSLLFLPSRTFPLARTKPRSYLMRVSAPSRSEVMARISSSAPGSGFNFSENITIDKDTQEYAGQLSWLVVGTTSALLIASLGLALGASGETEARRRRLRGLYVLGASPRDLTRSHFASVFVPFALVALAANSLAWFANRVMAFQDERAALSLTFFATALGASLLVAGVVAVATLPSALQPLSPRESAAIR